ncbi:unnamed protein product (macronuclear) [Paramecium tetraurelia]|uniref:Protein kinase domain-containing protein n=1 Tax=Paramecium tetraurelia TaxID=5888 RepID=A0CTL0_PARTE|nr:uncharacterized protein GSPATT00010361001 [Paramecium tetraurelia]CAK74127.1 unnamed protein product [Paramecium tetraurelia]|eukprot:XP_001441524.1 hypothetical protein (macronuclear) [Paramecium tetraurelia strain d4-2]
MQIIKVFIKSYDTPSGILSSRFITKNGRKITLILSDSKLYRISDKGLKMTSLSSHLRFQIKPNKLQNYLILETDFLPKPIEYQFMDQPGMWEIFLKQKLPLMDYQKYYEIEKLIGSGGFASVYIGKSKADGTKVAIKAFLKKMLMLSDPIQWRQQIDNEVKVMKYMNHQNILKLYDVFENKAQIYLITQLCRGGNLEQAIKKLEEPLPFLTVKVIFRQIVEGIKYMHDIGLMHRDIKPGNILFRKPVSLKQFGLSVQDGPLISDFGVSSLIQKQLNVYQFCGSYGYMAPEIFACEDDKQKSYNEKCDVFSLGCLLYELTTNKPLFSGNNIKLLNKECNINTNKLLEECYGNKQLISLLIKMLNPNPEQRIACSEVLSHPVMQVEYDEQGCPLFKDYKKPVILSIQKPRQQMKSKSSAILPYTSRRNETQSFKRLSQVLPPIKRLSTEMHN